MEQALEKFEEIGITEMVSCTLSSVKDFPSETVYAGFSKGGTSAELLVGTKSGARGCLLFHAALPLNMIGIEKWPSSGLFRFIMQLKIRGKINNLSMNFQRAFINLAPVMNILSILSQDTCS